MSKPGLGAKSRCDRYFPRAVPPCRLFAFGFRARHRRVNFVIDSSFLPAMASGDGGSALRTRLRRVNFVIRALARLSEGWRREKARVRLALGAGSGILGGGSRSACRRPRHAVASQGGMGFAGPRRPGGTPRKDGRMRRHERTRGKSGRARRGVSGALYLQPAPAGLNSSPRLWSVERERSTGR